MDITVKMFLIVCAVLKIPGVFLNNRKKQVSDIFVADLFFTVPV